MYTLEAGVDVGHSLCDGAWGRDGRKTAGTGCGGVDMVDYRGRGRGSEELRVKMKSLLLHGWKSWDPEC